MENEGTDSLPEHLVRLGESQWALWKTVALRGTGFPFSLVLSLASPECAAAADEIFQIEDEAARARADALKVVNEELDKLRAQNKWEERAERAPLVKAMRLLKAGRMPEPDKLPAKAQRSVSRLRESLHRVEDLLAEYHRRYEAAARQTSQTVREVVKDERFREAVTWQNRRAVHSGIEWLMRHTPAKTGRSFKHRQNEELAASYLQRYCVKNDTIGFFGPVGWARLCADDGVIKSVAGPHLLAERSVYFEGWGIDVLADTLAANPELRPWTAPRRMPYLHMDGNLLHIPLARPANLAPRLANVLRACDGRMPARDIAARLSKNPFLGFRDEEEIYKVLEELLRLGFISWTFHIPLEPYPERTLRRQLEAIPDTRLRALALAPLDELEARRAAVIAAAGDAAKLDAALYELEAAFVRLTGAATTRAAGKTYAGRTLVYEDCLRDQRVLLGPAIIQQLETPLGLLLTAARWLTFHTAKLCMNTLHEIYDEMVGSSGAQSVNAISFWMRAQPRLFDEGASLAAAVEAEFQARWEKLLAIPPGVRRVAYSCDELRARVSATFSAPHAGWPGARYHCPDLMLAASDLAEIERGHYQPVVGEVHVGLNTLGSSLFLSQHPCPEELLRAVELDFRQPRFMPVPPKSWPNVTSRTHNLLLSHKDFNVVVTHDSIPRPEQKAVPLAELVVEREGTQLTVRTRDGQARFSLIEAFGDVLAGLIVNSFRILGPAQHTPRVTFDRVVISREAWSFPVAELRYAFEETEVTCFLAARRWARLHELPRFVFVKVPVERKPFYVDFDSLTYVNLLTKMIRRTGQNSADALVTFVEMLPSGEQIWLQDRAGQRYTSEFRMVAVDLTN